MPKDFETALASHQDDVDVLRKKLSTVENHYIQQLKEAYPEEYSQTSRGARADSMVTEKRERFLHDLRMCITYVQREHAAWERALARLQAELDESSALDVEKANSVTWAYPASIVTALMVCVGEGCVGGVAMGLLVASVCAVPILPFVLGALIGVAGAVTNYYLFRSDLYDMFLKVCGFAKTPSTEGRLVRRIYLDDNGEEVPLWTKIFNWTTLLLALSAGFVYGSLSAMSMFSSALLPLFLHWGLHYGLAFGLGAALAACPVLFTTAAMAAIFFIVIVDFMNNRRWEGVIDYFRDNYFPAYFSELSLQEKIAHCLLHVPFQLLKLVLCLSICMIVSVASAGVFHKNSVGLLKLLSCPGGVAVAIAYMPTVVTAVLNHIFGQAKICKMSEWLTLRSALYALACFPVAAVNLLMQAVFFLPDWLYGHIQSKDTGQDQKQAELPLKAAWNNGVHAYYQCVEAWLVKNVRGETFCELRPPPTEAVSSSYGEIGWAAFLYSAAVLNGFGMGALFAETGGRFVNSLLHLGSTASKVVAGMSANIFSTVPNGMAIAKALADDKPSC